MRTIWKFPLGDSHGGSVDVEMPAGAVILHAEEQGRVPCLWAMVDTAAPPVIRFFSFVGTGWDLPDDMGDHVATYQSGPFVWHIFERSPQCVAPEPTR